jgi:hypothetical protein
MLVAGWTVRLNAVADGIDANPPVKRVAGPLPAEATR